jgi:hypothetical protein
VVVQYYIAFVGKRGVYVTTARSVAGESQDRCKNITAKDCYRSVTGDLRGLAGYSYCLVSVQDNSDYYEMGCAESTIAASTLMHCHVTLECSFNDSEVRNVNTIASI